MPRLTLLISFALLAATASADCTDGSCRRRVAVNAGPVRSVVVKSTKAAAKTTAAIATAPLRVCREYKPVRRGLTATARRGAGLLRPLAVRRFVPMARRSCH